MQLTMNGGLGNYKGKKQLHSALSNHLSELTMLMEDVPQA
jgi:hypothetical protein